MTKLSSSEGSSPGAKEASAEAKMGTTPLKEHAAVLVETLQGKELEEEIEFSQEAAQLSEAEASDEDKKPAAAPTKESRKLLSPGWKSNKKSTLVPPKAQGSKALKKPKAASKVEMVEAAEAASFPVEPKHKKGVEEAVVFKDIKTGKKAVVNTPARKLTITK